MLSSFCVRNPLSQGVLELEHEKQLSLRTKLSAPRTFGPNSVQCTFLEWGKAVVSGQAREPTNNLQAMTILRTERKEPTCTFECWVASPLYSCKKVVHNN